jgi:hypothetical protein
MHHYLAQHPQVFMPAKKEIHFFGSDLQFVDRLAADENDYLAMFGGAAPDALIGEASPYYLYSTSAAEEILAFAPAARVIIMLRNPVDQAYSHFCARRLSGTFARGQEHLRSFEEVRAEPERRRGRALPPGAPPDPLKARYLLYTDFARYAEHVERYLRAFGRSRVHVVWFEQLAAEPAAAFRDVCLFLGVDPTFRPDLTVRYRSRRPRLAPAVKVLAAPPELLRRIGRRLLPSGLRRLFLERLWRWAAPGPRPLDPTTRRTLQEVFRPDIRRLETLLDRDLRHWLSPGGG